MPCSCRRTVRPSWPASKTGLLLQPVLLHHLEVPRHRCQVELYRCHNERQDSPPAQQVCRRQEAHHVEQCVDGQHNPGPVVALPGKHCKQDGHGHGNEAHDNRRGDSDGHGGVQLRFADPRGLGGDVVAEVIGRKHNDGGNHSDQAQDGGCNQQPEAAFHRCRPNRCRRNLRCGLSFAECTVVVVWRRAHGFPLILIRE